MLNNLPLATILSLVAIATGVYLVVTNEIELNTTADFLEFFGGIGATLFGAGKLGEARNGAGHGVN